MSDERLFLGLISGTSADGIDAALVGIDDSSLRTIAADTIAFDGELKARLDEALAAPDAITAQALGEIDSAMGDSLAAAALTLLRYAGFRASDITAIGSHGQTLFHAPEGNPPFTLQIGDGARIAQGTGITTINDFRRADLAAGGQGAPLAPLLHDQLLRSHVENRAVVNLGGIANVTLLLPEQPTVGWDTGPANTLMDTWAKLCGVGDYDEGGVIASNGTVDQPLLERLLAEPYLAEPAPKSTGRELFNADWLLTKLRMKPAAIDAMSAAAQADIMATLCEFTADTVIRGIHDSAEPVNRVIICGGGWANRNLRDRLAAGLPDAALTGSGDFGLDPEFVEAVLFAWLAARRWDNLAIDTTTITGARHSVVAGCIHAAD
ncbi:MAG: anhydro-N-acetylmuramic acid kinase [Pseudomonadota bacterium]